MAPRRHLVDQHPRALHPPRNNYPYALRISGSVLPTVIWQIVVIGLFAFVICCIDEFTRIRINISPILISTMGFIVGLTLSFRTSTAYQRFWEARIAWDRMTSNARNLARLIWINVPERQDSSSPATASRDVLLKKSAINLIAIFAVSLKNHLRDQRGHVASDMRHGELDQDEPANGPSSARHHEADWRWQASRTPSMTYNATIRPRPNFDPALDREESEIRSTWFLHRPLSHSSTDREASEGHGKTGQIYLDAEQHPSHAHRGASTTDQDWCEPTLRAGILPTELTFYLASYMEYVRAQNPTIPNYFPQNFNLYLNYMNEIVSTCERIRRTPIPVAYNIVISQILWIFCLSLPFQLSGVLSWASIPLCMIASMFLFSLAAIGTEIEDPFGKDANDLDLERYCRAIRIELDVLTSIPPPNVMDWAIQNHHNLPLHGVSDKTFAQLETMDVAVIRAFLKQKASQGSEQGARNGRVGVGIDRAATIVDEPTTNRREPDDRAAGLLDV